MKGGYSSFMVKCGITKDFIENHRVLFDSYMHKALPHTMFPRTFHLCERYGFWSGFGVSPKIHKRKKSVVLGPKCTFLAHKFVCLGALT